MYIHVISGWRYRPGMRAKTRSQVERMRVNAGGSYPLMPDAPGLLARLWGTDPDEPDTGIAIWVWESKEAAEAFQFPWEGENPVSAPLDNRIDFSEVQVRALDGMYLALSNGFLQNANGIEGEYEVANPSWTRDQSSSTKRS
jgi:hypothetical protein